MDMSRNVVTQSFQPDFWCSRLHPVKLPSFRWSQKESNLFFVNVCGRNNHPSFRLPWGSGQKIWGWRGKSQFHGQLSPSPQSNEYKMSTKPPQQRHSCLPPPPPKQKDALALSYGIFFGGLDEMSWGDKITTPVSPAVLGSLHPLGRTRP